jgi:hypothetical protein
METKSQAKSKTTVKNKTVRNGVQKKMSKFMQGAMKYQGAFDKEEVNKYLALHE